MNKFLIPLLSVLFALNVSAQDVVLDESYSPIDPEDIEGPNTKTFTHFYSTLGFFVDPPTDNMVDLKYGTSNQYLLGYRYKVKLSNVFAVFSDLAVSRSKISYDQKSLPTGVSSLGQLEKSFFRFYETQFAPGIRINFDPGRGNFIGLYLDMGAYLAYSFSTTSVMKFTDNTDLYTNAVYRQNNLAYMNDVNYGAKVRLGYNKYALVVQYRVSDLMNNKAAVEDLSRVSVGFEFGVIGK